MQTSWFYGLAAAILLSLATAPVLADTVEGELVDSRCYLNMGAVGSDHQMCAQTCAKSGLPLGVLTGKGKYYTLVVQPQPLAEYAGEQRRFLAGSGIAEANDVNQELALSVTSLREANSGAATGCLSGLRGARSGSTGLIAHRALLLLPKRDS